METQGEMVRKLKVWRDSSVGLTEGVDRDCSPGKAALRWVRKAGQEHPRPERKKALDQTHAGAWIFRSWPGCPAPGPAGRTSSGVPGCVTQGGGPRARGWDHRVGGRSAFQPRASATLAK